jgi:hypothetical protein
MHERSARPRSTWAFSQGRTHSASSPRGDSYPQPLPSTYPDRYTSPITRTGHLRASDADRDQVAERLRAAATEGRIGFDELEERLASTLSSRTYGELESVVADLPSAQPARRRSPLPASPVARIAIALAVAVPVIVAAVLVFATFISAWAVWAIVGWYLFGHHRHYGYYRHSHRAYGPRHAQRQAGAGPSRGFWT